MYILFGLLVLREGISLEKLYLNIFLIDLINYLKLMVDANGHRAKTNVKKLIQLLISKKNTRLLIPRERERHKMPYRYSKIYNATQAAWAYNLAGQDDPKKLWADNDWEVNDALVGFYSENAAEFYNIIFCLPGYAIYVQTQDEKDKANFQYGDLELRIPPAIIVNLNNAFDTDFLHAKVHPSDMDDGEDDAMLVANADVCDGNSVCDCQSNETLLYSPILENQRIINFLYSCRDNVNSQFKKAAYSKAINEIHSYNAKINRNSWKPCTIGSSIERKIKEFLDGIPESDIINS